MKKIDFQNYGPGRPVKSETLAVLEKMYNIIAREPGIPSAKVAVFLRLHSLRCAVLARKLEAMGHLTIVKEKGTLHYTVKE